MTEPHVQSMVFSTYMIQNRFRIYGLTIIHGHYSVSDVLEATHMMLTSPPPPRPSRISHITHTLSNISHQVILDVLDVGKPLNESIPNPRLHHQLFPNEVRIEDDFPQDIVTGLEARGHRVEVSNSSAVVQGIYIDDQGIHATSDPRKGGAPAGF